MSTFYFAWPNR